LTGQYEDEIAVKEVYNPPEQDEFRPALRQVILGYGIMRGDGR